MKPHLVSDSAFHSQVRSHSISSGLSASGSAIVAQVLQILTEGNSVGMICSQPLFSNFQGLDIKGFGFIVSTLRIVQKSQIVQTSGDIRMLLAPTPPIPAIAEMATRSFCCNCWCRVLSMSSRPTNLTTPLRGRFCGGFNFTRSGSGDCSQK